MTINLTINQGDPEELPVVSDLRLDLRPPDVRDGVATAALLADPTRAGIVAMLRDGPHCVCEMAAAFGERQNNMSNHLARLRDAGLVRVSRGPSDGRRIYYERDEAACVAAVVTLREILG
jgi:DNA-binding transcriptional ArsR family regulator